MISTSTPGYVAVVCDLCRAAAWCKEGLTQTQLRASLKTSGWSRPTIDGKLSDLCPDDTDRRAGTFEPPVPPLDALVSALRVFVRIAKGAFPDRTAAQILAAAGLTSEEVAAVKATAREIGS